MNDSNVTRLRTAAGPRPFVTAGQALERSGITPPPTTVEGLLGAISSAHAELMLATSAWKSGGGDTCRERALNAAARSETYLAALKPLLGEQPPMDVA